MFYRVEINLADNEEVILGEAVWGDFQIEWSWSLTDATTSVVMGTVARAIIAAEFSRVGDWHATQMSADTEDDEPLWFLDTFTVLLGVTKG